MVNLLNLPVSRKCLEKYRNMHTRQIERAAKQWDARQAEIQNNLLRKEWLERQAAHNYHAEYERVRRLMSHYRPPHVVPHQIRDRETFSCGLAGPYLPR